MSRKGDRAELWSAVIVDDEQPARRRLENLLAREGDVAVVGSTDDPEDALSLIAAQRPDLLFVDVQMPRVTGIDLVRIFRPNRCRWSCSSPRTTSTRSVPST